MNLDTAIKKLVRFIGTDADEDIKIAAMTIMEAAKATPAKGLQLHLYHVHTKDYGISEVVGAINPVGAAKIVADIVGGDNPGTGGVCIVEKLSPPDDKVGSAGAYLCFVQEGVYFDIKPNRVRAVLVGGERAFNGRKQRTPT